jgi:ankyrin repeat protein
MTHSLVVDIFNNCDTDQIIDNIESFDVNEKFGPSEVTPLIAAIRSDNYHLVEELIEEGANINMPDKLGNTPLIIACCFANDLDIIKELLQKNANPNIANKGSFVPLEIAMLSKNRLNPVTNEYVSNREEVIKELLLYNADISLVKDYKFIEKISMIARNAGIGIGQRTTNILSQNGELKYE